MMNELPRPLGPGVTAEATHIYDPQHSLGHAYRTLCAQWRLAFAIGAAQQARGATVTGVWELVQLVRKFQQQQRPFWMTMRSSSIIIAILIIAVLILDRLT